MKKPNISAVTLSKNTVNAKETFTIAITVTDKDIVFSIPKDYAGEKYTGQEIGVI